MPLSDDSNPENLAFATRSRILRVDDGARLQYQRVMIVVESGPEEGLEYELKGKPVVIGRNPGVGLRLEDRTVSREHARLEPSGAGWMIRDLGSKSGTRVNGVVVESAQLEPGFQIQLGTSVLSLRVDQAFLSAPRHQEAFFNGILGASEPMRELFGLVQRVGPLDLPVLLQGESGTGKERLARAVHHYGPAPDSPFVVVDCTLLGDSEHTRSELFGHVKGAFTGADKAREGAFQRADGGTLFLDEIGELPAPLQAQLLRVLQEGEVRPLGGAKVHRIQTRVVSATNRSLETMVTEGTFRQDLYYRLSGLILDVPPLRDRGDDVLLLARHFLPEGLDLDPGAEPLLHGHDWPGNVRELEFCMRQAAALCQGGKVRAQDLRLRRAPSPNAMLETGAIPVLPQAHAVSPGPVPAAPFRGPPATGAYPGVAPAPAAQPALDPLQSRRGRAASLTREAIVAALQQTGGNRNEAAKLLGVSRATLFRRLKELRDQE